jgi:hypothetical protein
MMTRITSPLLLLVFGLVLALSLVVVAPAYASQAVCTTNGGTWQGVDTVTGTCTYDSTNSEAIAGCGSSRYTYLVQYFNAVEVGSMCKPLWGGGYTAVVSDGARQGSFSLHLKNGKGSVTFANGCDSNCSINSTLPDGPGKESLYLTPLATLYVRAGDSSNSYTACFRNDSGGSVRIYRYAGGIWTPISAPSTASVVCASATGDGSFYLH